MHNVYSTFHLLYIWKDLYGQMSKVSSDLFCITFFCYQTMLLVAGGASSRVDLSRQCPLLPTLQWLSAFASIWLSATGQGGVCSVSLTQSLNKQYLSLVSLPTACKSCVFPHLIESRVLLRRTRLNFRPVII